MPAVGGRFSDLSTDHEAFESFPFPFSGLADLCSEIPDVLDRVDHRGLGFDKTPLVCKLVNNVCRLCDEIFCVFVDAVKMKS